jgi:hypothetical protein
MKLTDLPLGLIPLDLIPVQRVPYSKKITDAVAKNPDLAELRKLAEEEKAVIELQKNFSTEAARAEHTRLLQEATSSMDAAKIRSVGSPKEMVSAYEGAYKNLSEKIQGIHARALPALESITAEVVSKLLKLRDDAVADLQQVFESRGIPPVPSDFIADPYTRAIQELLENIRRERDRNLRGMALSRFLSELGCWS